MEKSRREAIENVMLHLHGTCEAFLSGDQGCGFECKSIMYGALILQIRSSSLLSPTPATPFPGISYKSLIQEVSSFRSPRWFESSASFPKRAHTYRHDCSDSSFKTLFANLNHSIEGLQLDKLSNP
jgi:hypothetical protein